jgi:hypothetical protein
MIGCWRRTPQLAAYVDGELIRTEAAELERHVARCSRCSERLRRLQETDILLSTARPNVEPVSVELSRVLFAEALQRSGVQRGGMRRYWGGAWAIAGSLGLVLACNTAGNWRQPDPRSGMSLQAKLTPQNERPTPAPVEHPRAQETEPARPQTLEYVVHRVRRVRRFHHYLATRVEGGPDEPLASELPMPSASGEQLAAYAHAPEGQLLLVVQDASDLTLEVKDLPASAPGSAMAMSVMENADGRRIQKEVRVSSDHPDPELILTGGH